MTSPSIVIVGAMRTPIGNFLGELQTFTAPQLGGHAIQATLANTSVTPEDVDAVIMGCVLPAGLGQAPARQASFQGGLPQKTACTTMNKMCGSGMQAVILAHDALLANSHRIMVAGGMESMSNAPYLLPKARTGYRLGHQTCIDHMLYDGLEDAYQRGQSMGVFADITAKEFHISRETQDEFAIRSVERAKAAMAQGAAFNGIAPITVRQKTGEVTIDSDEGPRTARVEKIPQLKASFTKDGSVTPANASSISDGAAALLLMKEEEAAARHLKPLARIVAHHVHAQAPEWFTTAPVGAIQGLLKKTGWQIEDVDLFEINEAFAIVTLVTQQELNIPLEKINILGGACVMGHPIGATGARILVTLIHALQWKGLKRGIAALCIGGGEATAMGIELL